MRKATLFMILIFFAFKMFSQQSEIFMTVGSNKISTDEFLHIYKKNNSDNINQESLDEYLELFKNFKLKVVEAQNLKMDTSEVFINELQGYKDQLAKPYLTENIKYEELIDEAFKRNRSEIKLDIIFIKLSKHASPEDTTLTYEKVFKIRDRILGGENFEKVATETSDDRQVSQNKGHLSFLPVLRIPYRIQSYAFNAKKGVFSMPLRANYGYYIVRLVDKRPAQGFYKVSHIMINSTEQLSKEESAKKKERIDSIYKRIQSGDKFEDLVKYSDDKGTAKKGGELLEFTTGKMVPEFEEIAFKLNNPGDISKPFKTRFGWHIMKLIEKRPPEDIEKQKDKIKKTIEKDPERKELVKKFVINKLKDEYNYKKISEPTAFYNIVDSTIFEGKWVFSEKANYKSTLFSINGKKYNERSFGQFIVTKQKRTGKNDITSFVNSMFEDFIYESLIETEKSRLENKYPPYKFLMQEYHDGMLIFDLMKKEVWDKASTDSSGLKRFFNENKMNYNNQIEFDISVFKYKDVKYYNEAVRLLNKERKKYNDDLLVEKISGNKKQVFKKVESGVFIKGESIYADKIYKMMQENKIIENQKVVNFPKEKTFIYINSKKISKEKQFEEIKGILIADYQEYLEKNWMIKLKKKYNIVINEKVLKRIEDSIN